MKVFQTCGLAMLVMAAVVGGIAPAAEAAGAIAIGDCDGHGFAYNHRSYGAARAAALAECRAAGNNNCQVVVVFRNACGAFAIGGQCGARGWAYAGSRRQAERLALNECIKHGGTSCYVRRWVCDR
jgi:hypothetical protein